MAKGFRTVDRVRGRDPMLRRAVCEVRYQDGQLYLDHCGRLLKRLLRDAPEWVIAPDPTPQGTTVHNVLTESQLGLGLSSASLVMDKSSADGVIDPEEMTEFMEQVEAVLGMVLDELEITELTRIGYR